MEQVSLTLDANAQGGAVSEKSAERSKVALKQRTRCEVWSRVVGYLRPTSKWNDGKQEEFKDRALFSC